MDQGLGVLDDKDYCAAAGAVGQPETLKWLREKKCPWDPMKVSQEAGANLQAPVLQYVGVRVVGGYDVRRCAGYGLCLDGEKQYVKQLDATTLPLSISPLFYFIRHFYFIRIERLHAWLHASLHCR